jgi:serine/threonine protein phosphatase PrpC
VIQVERAHLNIIAATHPGMQGKVNEDRYAITAYRSNTDAQTPSVLALLADGIGGHRGGEVAAQLAVENINKYIANSPIDQPVQVLKQAFNHTNQLILNYSKENQSLMGMGTTCVCAWVIGNQLFAAYLGDSRLYLQRGVELNCLTIDHTWVQEALVKGLLLPEQVKGHPNAHIIRRFLGSLNSADPDIRLRLSAHDSDFQAEANQGLRLLPGDRLLLCSDGLTDLVSDDEILEALDNQPFQNSSNWLIDLANQRGGHDNITVIVLEYPQPAHITQPIRQNPLVHSTRQQKNRPSTASRWMVILLILAIILMALLLVYQFTR